MKINFQNKGCILYNSPHYLVLLAWATFITWICGHNLNGSACYYPADIKLLICLWCGEKGSFPSANALLRLWESLGHAGGRIQGQMESKGMLPENTGQGKMLKDPPAPTALCPFLTAAAEAAAAVYTDGNTRAGCPFASQKLSFLCYFLFFLCRRSISGQNYTVWDATFLGLLIFACLGTAELLWPLGKCADTFTKHCYL